MKEFEIAIKAVRKAGVILEKYFGKTTYKLKGIGNPVTIADIESQKEITNAIKKHFKFDSILAEENLNEIKNKDRLWILDPLDGTVNYAHSYPHFAISLAFIFQNEIIFGIVYDVKKDEMFYAIKNKGAFLNGKRIFVSKVSNLKDSLLATGFAYDRGKKAEYYCSFYSKFLKISHDIRRAGAASLDMAWLACGRFDGYWEFNLKPWDVAAGKLIVEEAGGKVTDMQGKNWEMDLNSIKKWGKETLCSNLKIHSEMLKILKVSH